MGERPIAERRRLLGVHLRRQLQRVLLLPLLLLQSLVVGLEVCGDGAAVRRGGLGPFVSVHLRVQLRQILLLLGLLLERRLLLCVVVRVG